MLSSSGIYIAKHGLVQVQQPSYFSCFPNWKFITLVRFDSRLGNSRNTMIPLYIVSKEGTWTNEKLTGMSVSNVKQTISKKNVSFNILYFLSKYSLFHYKFFKNIPLI